MVENMKKIIAWLEENGIEYSVDKFGNPYYFNDGFTVDGIQVSFYFDGIGNAWEKKEMLEKFMKRKKSYVCYDFRFGAGYTYRIMTVSDYVKLIEHEKAIDDAVKKFWQEEHARRMRIESKLA